MANIKLMFPPQKDSPSTFLLGDITTTDVVMTVANIAVLPQTFPYPLTLGFDKSVSETVFVDSYNVDQNEIHFTRGSSPMSWTAGTKVARVLRADDIETIHFNISAINDESADNAIKVAALEPIVEANTQAIGDSSSGLVKAVNDEATRAKAAESAEASRADTEEKRIDAAKPERTELPQVITDWTYSADGTKVRATITRYNAATKQTSTYTRDIPLISDSTAGAMTPEAYNEISALRVDVNALINQGGRFIGVSFATKANLDSYQTPASVKASDYTYVLDDETKSGATTRYVWNGTSWDFAFIVESDPVGIADAITAGVVKSDSGSTNGKVFVETDGTMSVIGWDSLVSKANTTESNLNSHTGNTDIHVSTTEKNAWNSKAAGDHTHDDRYYTETEADELLAGKSPTTHNHDDRYYTEAEADELLAGKSPTTHTHTATDIGADQAGAAAAVQTNLDTHTADVANPHAVTAAQVGLGSVENKAFSSVLGRSTNVNVADTNYTTLMARGIGLVSVDTTPTVNGSINFTYG